MYCVYCGKEIPSDGDFCPYCGKKRPGSNVPSEPEPEIKDKVFSFGTFDTNGSAIDTINDWLRYQNIVIRTISINSRSNFSGTRTVLSRCEFQYQEMTEPTAIYQMGFFAHMRILVTNQEGLDRELDDWKRQNPSYKVVYSTHAGHLMTNGQSTMSLYFLYTTTERGRKPQNKGQAHTYSSMNELKEAAIQGYPDAQYWLAIYFYSGIGGFERDTKEAFNWMMKAAEQGYAQAQCQIGIYYLNGEVVGQNDKEGVKWLTESANQGCKEGQYNLGLCYEFGRGVFKDKDVAINWFSKAADQGYDKAISKMKEL